MADRDTSAPEAAGDEPSFERALDELRAVVRELEGGSLGLEASLARFEAGVALLRTCRTTLDRAERRVDLLTGTDEDGNPATEPFDASATGDGGKAGRRASGANSSSHPRNRKRAGEDEEEPAGLF